VTVLACGGHIAEIFDKQSGINPLWTPPWPSIEPSEYDPAKHQIYGNGSDAKLLAGIMGHNLCLDLFGGPSRDEECAGLTAHGEGSVVEYDIDIADELTMRAVFPLACLRFERRIALDGRTILFSERVENLSAFDRPIGWTQHVTLGPPFLARGENQFRTSATRSKVFEGRFGADDYLAPGAEFDWPGPLGSVFTSRAKSSAYTAHLMDPAHETAFFAAWSPAQRLALAYAWKRADFPWMGIWEENHSRTHSPWNGETLTRGMEFGVSPFPEPRREMVDRGSLFGTRTYGWLPAKGTLQVEYLAATAQIDQATGLELLGPAVCRRLSLG
jgi:hypothetical protein